MCPDIFPPRSFTGLEEFFETDVTSVIKWLQSYLHDVLVNLLLENMSQLSKYKFLRGRHVLHGVLVSGLGDVIKKFSGDVPDQLFSCFLEFADVLYDCPVEVEKNTGKVPCQIWVCYLKSSTVVRYRRLWNSIIFDKTKVDTFSLQLSHGKSVVDCHIRNPWVFL
ncbi:hypothetical protein [Salmon gill poxvirus]|nr:hypothetical protein [Salmon gill poxvirus]